jgi:hypothetical protein
MPQPILRRDTRSRLNAALTGHVGAKLALARRTGVDPATITRAFQPASATAVEPSADVVVEALALLVELGDTLTLEHELRARGANIKVLREDALIVDHSDAMSLLREACAGGERLGELMGIVRESVEDGVVDRNECKSIITHCAKLREQLARVEAFAVEAARLK